MIRRLCLLLLIAAPLALPASKEILDLQRDVANLQEMIRQLTQAQSAQTQQLTAFGVMVQQALDASKSADKSVAVIQGGIQRSLDEQKKEVVAPVAGLNTRMDQVSNDVRQLTQAVSDLTSSMSKLQAQLTDINNAIKVLQTPPPPPPSNTGGGAPTGMNGSGTVPAVPPMPATDLWIAATNDRSAGKLDLALQEFTDYVKWYGNLDLAGTAQFYIGSIHWSQGAYDTAASDFDAVLEKYPDNPKVQEAHYYKGLCLKKMGKRTQSRAEFDAAVKENPRKEAGVNACNELKDMGFSCPTMAPPAKAPQHKKRD